VISSWFGGGAKSDPAPPQQSASPQKTQSSNGYRSVRKSQQALSDRLRDELLKTRSQASTAQTQSVSNMTVATAEPRKHQGARRDRQEASDSLRDELFKPPAQLSSTRTQPASDMTVAPAKPPAEHSTDQSLELKVVSLPDDWRCDYNMAYISSEASLPSTYARLQLTHRPGADGIIVKVARNSNAGAGCIHIAHTHRINLRLNDSRPNWATLTPCKSPPNRCWDSVSLLITSVRRSDNRSCETRKTKKSESALGKAFLKQFQTSGCPLVDGHLYVFDEGEHTYMTRLRLGSSKQAEKSGGLLTKNASVATVEPTRITSKILAFSGAATPTVNPQQLSARFEFNGERYGVGGLEKHIQRFVNELVAPRLLSSALQEKMHSSISRGGILSGPPGTGKTLFINALGSLLRDNGFAVEEQTISGPEVFNAYMGKSEANVREIFANASDDPKTIHLILIDEIDSMLPCRGGMSDSTGAGSKVVNQFLTCLDGIQKKNNLVVFGTTNRPDLIDPAVMRPGRMNIKMQFSLPDETQRRQILQIQTKELNDGTLQPDVSLDWLAAQTRGFTGAELAAVIDSAKVSALRRAQGLSEDDMYFSPQGLNKLEGFDLNADDFRFALDQIKPQFGKSDFMPLNGKSYESGGYPANTVDTLRTTLRDFKQDANSSVLRILIQGPAGSGKSTLAALAQRDFDSFCSYVSAAEVVTSRDRRLPLVNAFSQRTNQQSGCHTVMVDDFDTMINYDGSNYDRGLVSILDAYTKQSLQGMQKNKQLVMVTATEHKGVCGTVPFLPMLFPESVVFKTR